MRSIARTLVLASALAGSLPLFAEALVASDLKAFTAKMDAARARCDIDTVIDRVSPLATISGTGFAQGDTTMYRFNKQQYGALLKLLCMEDLNYKYTRTGERISIDGDQATITSDVAESFVTQEGQTVLTKIRDKTVIELIDGKLMLVQLVSNQTEANIASR